MVKINALPALTMGAAYGGSIVLGAFLSPYFPGEAEKKAKSLLATSRVVALYSGVAFFAASSLIGVDWSFFVGPRAQEEKIDLANRKAQVQKVALTIVSAHLFSTIVPPIFSDYAHCFFNWQRISNEDASQLVTLGGTLFCSIGALTLYIFGEKV